MARYQKLKKPNGYFDSRTAARKAGVSYQKLMRMVKDGLAVPANWTGNPRTPVWWAPVDIRRAETADRLLETGLTAAQIRAVFARHWAVFENGFVPMWLSPLLDTDTGKTSGNAITLFHENGYRVTGNEKKRTIGSSEIFQCEVYFLPIWTGKKGGKRRGTRNN